MLTIYGRSTSSNVQSVMWLIGELGLPHQRIDKGHVFGGLDDADFRAMNPHGLIPVLTDDGGLAIWKSTAILRYLAATYGGPKWWANKPAARAQVEMWMDWIKIYLSSEMTAGVFWSVVRTAAKDRDEAALARALDKVTEALGKLDRRLQTQPFVSGQHIGLADIAIGHLLYRYYVMDIPRASLPTLAAYYDGLTRRAAYREHVMVSYESLRVEGA